MRRSPWRMLGRILLRIVAASAVLLVIAGLAGLVVVQSGWFHEYVRKQIIATLEHATGGRVEIGRFSFRGPTLTATVAPLVLHGREPAGDPPLLQVESVTVGLRILSFAERKVDLATVKLQKPQFHVVINPDGTNNFPGHDGKGDWPVDLIDMAVGHYEVSDATIELDARTVPVNLRGDGLTLKLTYDPRTPSYLVDLGSRGLRVVAPGVPSLQLGFTSKFTLEKTRFVISNLHLSTPQAHADLKGVLANPKEPYGTLNLQAAGSLKEVVSLFPVPIDPVGSADFAGTLKVDFGKLSEFVISGRLNALGAGYSNGRLHIKGAEVRAKVELRSHKLDAGDIQADALGSHFTGKLSWEDWNQLHVEGNVEGLTVAEAASIVTPRPMPWNGTLAGSLMVDTVLDENNTVARANLGITPAAQGTPIEGLIDASYDQHEGEISFGDSYIATPSTRLDASGVLGRRMEVRLRSTNLGDLLAALPVLEDDAPQELPLKLALNAGGSVAATGDVTGSLANPRFHGQATIVSASVVGHNFDKFDGDVDVSNSQISASRFTLARGATDASGAATLTANQDSFDDAQVTGQFNLRNVNLEEFEKEAGVSVPVAGTASGLVRVSGSIRQPQADLTFNVANVRAYGETLDRVTGALKISLNDVEVSNGEADDGPGKITFSGAYRPAASNDWNSGELQLQVATANLPVNRIEVLTSYGTGLDARVTADFKAQARVGKGTFVLSSASGTLSAQSVTIKNQPLGELSLTAQTNGQVVSVDAKGRLDTANLEGKGSWSLDAGQNGSATVRFSRMTVDDVHRMAMLTGAAPHQAEPDLPLEGFLAGGNVAVNLALSHPKDFQATVTIDALQFNPKAGQVLGLGVQTQDVVLKSAQPIVIGVTAREARIQPARLTGRDTNLELSGTIPLTASAGGADLSVRGTVNLAALQLLNPNLLARGNATVEAGLRGALADPSLNGRMDLKGASLYMKDDITGLDNVTGGVLFNRNRATIDKLTAQIGSGMVSLGGFVEFASPLVYRLQATAQQVRIRLPIDLSTTFSANLALNGTSDASTLSGTLTLNRAAFNPQTDLGELLSAFSSPSPEDSGNDYLRGMHFDVRIASSPSFELQTSLTRDVQSDVDLQLRGTPVRPLLLGSISVDSGQVQVFGNQYNINRGDIRFTNAVKIEPVFDLALETKVSGVSVSVTFNGTVDKLKTNYSSDPPLESSKIIALLAVGRDPSQFADSTSAQTSSSSANFVGAGGSLLSQALSAQLTSKLQRFLGASRLKIDPTMTGIDNTPQARLTFEQQVSKDVTMTYITNLNYTAEQIVRVQWDLNKNWSAIAVRDANGLFGIDFQYKRRFK